MEAGSDFLVGVGHEQMITDCFFQQGVTHEVCEDYALAGQSFAVVSDGCSNGGGPRIDTDWGARLLCKAAERNLLDLRQRPEVFITTVAKTALLQLSTFNMPVECLTATLAMLHMREGAMRCRGLIVGDGVIGGRRYDGSWRIVNFEYLPGGSVGRAAPFYLKYAMTGEVQKYMDLYGGKMRRTEYNGTFGDLSKPESVTYEMTREEIEFDFDPECFYHQVWFDVKEFAFAFVASDGVSSFYRHVRTETNKYTEAVGLLQVLGVLLNVPPPRSGFLRAQRQWAFKRDVAGSFVRRGWHNADDVSVGAIYF